MPGLHQPIAVQPASGDASLVTTAQEFRQHITTMLGAGNSYIGAEGVTNVGVPASGAMTGDFAVTQRGAGANGSVDVSSGHCLINGDDITAQGCYSCWSDATVNVTVPLSPPAQRIHRLIIQIQDKLTNLGWSGYQVVPVLLPDIGSGTPAQPGSAITLALITVNPSDVSVQNAAIQDYRRAPGPVSFSTAANESRTNNVSPSDSTSLQFWGLRHSAWYGFLGFLYYDGATQAGTGDAGGFRHTWRTPGPSNVKLYYTALRLQNLTGSTQGAGTPGGWRETDQLNAATTGAGNTQGQALIGSIQTGTTIPNMYAALQFSQVNTSGTATRLLTGSAIYAWPIS
jgi:hypothetical protein